MTGFIVSVFPFRNRVSFKEAFEGLELGEGKLSRPVLRGLGGRKAAWLLGSNPPFDKNWFYQLDGIVDVNRQRSGLLDARGFTFEEVARGPGCSG